MWGLLKPRIDALWKGPDSRQTRRRRATPSDRDGRLPLTTAAMLIVDGRVEAVAHQGVDVTGLGLIQELGDLVRRDRLAAQPGLHPLQTKRRQHQQPGYQRDEQPRHSRK